MCACTRIRLKFSVLRGSDLKLLGRGGDGSRDGSRDGSSCSQAAPSGAHQRFLHCLLDVDLTHCRELFTSLAENIQRSCCVNVGGRASLAPRSEGGKLCAHILHLFNIYTEFTTAAAQRLERPPTPPPAPSPDPGASTSAALVLLFLSQFENYLLQYVLQIVTTTPLFLFKKKKKAIGELKHFQKCDSEMQQFKVQTEGT